MIDQSIDLIGNGIVTNYSDYSSFDCLWYNIINSISILFFILLSLLSLLTILKLSSILISSQIIIGSLSSLYLPLFHDLLLFTSSSFITIPVNIIEVIAGFNSYSLYYIVLSSINQLITAFIFTSLLVLMNIELDKVKLKSWNNGSVINDTK